MPRIHPLTTAAACAALLAASALAGPRTAGAASPEAVVVMRDTTPAAQPWHAGGTLHRATVPQWRTAASSDRLATSADLAARILRRRSPADLREQAEELMMCISTLAAVVPPEHTVDELAASCAVRLGWKP